MIGISKLSWFVSIVLHGALLALLILGPSLRPTVRPDLPSGNFMPAELIDPASLELPPLEEPVGPTPAELERERLAQELEQQRLEELAQQQKDQEEQDRIKVQEQEEERLRVKAQADAEAKKLADEKKADELIKEQARIKKIEDDKKELARVEREKEQERVKKEEAVRVAKEKQAAEEEAERVRKKKEEDERKRLEAKKIEDEKKRIEKEKEEKRLAKVAAEKAAKQKAEAERIAAQEAREEQMRQMMGVEDQRNKAVDNGLLAQYIAQIVARVERNWNRPPGAKEGLSCTVKATQIPGGEVVRVEVVKCNGDAVVQKSIERAVFKASPLPEPADSSLFERNLVFIFEPT